LGRTLIDNLKPGMKLARPVTNKGGMVMLAEDTELTMALIDKMRDMDIQGVFVQGLSGPAMPKDEMLCGLEERFASVPDEPRMAILKRIMRDHLEGLYER
jgi:hypothetical protein